MARIASLHVYPVKSCAGIELDEAVLGRAGLEAGGIGDREWMLVDVGGGRFVTQREAPRMALIRPVLLPDRLALDAPDMPRLEIAAGAFAPGAPDLQVTVWNHTCLAFDAGDAAAAWFSAFLSRAVRLARFDPAHRRLANRERTGAFEALNRFSDGYPILAISEASLADLNRRLAQAGRDALPMNRFRPNIVLADVGPFDEDRCVALRDGGVELRAVKPCPRCPIPSIDQSTARHGPDPLDILSRYRDDPAFGVVFGQNMITVSGQGATLRRDQVFEPEWNF